MQSVAKFKNTVFSTINSLGTLSKQEMSDFGVNFCHWILKLK